MENENGHNGNTVDLQRVRENEIENVTGKYHSYVKLHIYHVDDRTHMAFSFFFAFPHFEVHAPCTGRPRRIEEGLTLSISPNYHLISNAYSVFSFCSFAAHIRDWFSVRSVFNVQHMHKQLVFEYSDGYLNVNVHAFHDE